jgi:2-methylcitrate dehydratase PrpD
VYRVGVEDYSAQLAAYAADFRLADAPAEVVRMAKRVVLDQLGCQIACSTLPWSLQTRDAVLALGTGGGATIVYHGDRVGVDNAAFLNSAFGHGNEIDDASVRTPSHCGSVIVPAALAVAEHRRSSGRAVLEAVIIGYEVWMRISYATEPQMRRRGHHSPPAHGPFGAAAAVAHLMGLDQRTTLNALAIAGSHAAGLAEYTRGGGSVKRIHCGIGSMAGVRSAFMAAYGMTGPPAVLEGERGFCNVFAGECDLAQLVRGLGSDYDILQTGFKRYSCAFVSHTALEAMDAICARHQLTAADIAGVTVGVNADAAKHFYAGGPPTDLLTAQFSLGHSLAIRLLRTGNGPWDWRVEDLGAPDVIAFASRVRTVVDPVADREKHDNMGALVQVTTRDGRTFEERQRYSKGLPENPLSDDEFAAKFTSLAVPQLGTTAATRIIDWVERLDAHDDAATLIPLLLRN